MGVKPFFENNVSNLKYGLHNANVATRELALSQGRCSKVQQLCLSVCYIAHYAPSFRTKSPSHKSL